MYNEIVVSNARVDIDVRSVFCHDDVPDALPLTEITF